jgi:hypothetical protein
VFEVSADDENRSGIGDPDHLGDALYSDYSADQLLEKLGLRKPDLWTSEDQA